ncbi:MULTISPECIES: hypothetical protein [unclassified Myroides]|uniref:hypothetical protein n=1 Tax=unclassified Myroides TaxID=2642485 RepID=UPI0015F9E6D1|nr:MULTISPECIES: hypothetical protein [unclassified Myroides]MBB1149756.1 hypothetical protein [Myroides sp. NP-2]MDM1408196.1 hypothetical protein [Myroides sp. DF42-4-2]
MSKIKKRGRIIIYAHDVMLITGLSYRTALRILIQVRRQFQKPSGALVTCKEFCSYMHLDENEVVSFLQ